jgi:DNA-directed RNA polymerase subunit N (RpoN/RPB10)
MIIPVRCFTCNRVIGSKYKKYQEKIKELNLQNENIISGDPDIDLSKKTPYQEVFEQLGIDRYCCKRHLLTNVDLIEKI